MNQLKLDQHGKPGSTGWPFRSSTELLNSAHLRSRSPDSNPGSIGLARERLTSRSLSCHPTVLISNFNQSTKLRHRAPFSLVSYYLTTDLIELHWSLLLTGTPVNTS
ncbi:unnamed protein product [Schistosoma mattheei]|uniref:Uncharacterized protein n=1 Tax=Schistosoma mattheei TaxID=31246 RepID=A0AA85BHN5_9TREM|nr:unnamed protein product [Schistosoma mattheei]